MRDIPVITKNLLIINVLAFLAMKLLGPSFGISLNDMLGLHFFLASDFHVYQLFSYMFMHANFEHILFNMFSLWMFGCVVERMWGARRFLFYYIVCGVGAGILQEIAQFGQFWFLVSGQFPDVSFGQLFQIATNSDAVLNSWTTVGASGAIYAILLAFGMIFPEERIFIFPLPFPIKGKWFVVICAAIEFISAWNWSNSNVAHLAHLGGMLFGFLLIRYWRRNPDIGYGGGNAFRFFENVRSRWEKRDEPRNATTYTRHEDDWDYNRRKQMEQAEIDRILDKIRKSGYDSLSKEEKQKLFDQSNNR